MLRRRKSDAPLPPGSTRGLGSAVGTSGGDISATPGFTPGGGRRSHWSFAIDSEAERLLQVAPVRLRRLERGLGDVSCSIIIQPEKSTFRSAPGSGAGPRSLCRSRRRCAAAARAPVHAQRPASTFCPPPGRLEQRHRSLSEDSGWCKFPRPIGRDSGPCPSPHGFPGDSERRTRPRHALSCAEEGLSL